VLTDEGSEFSRLARFDLASGEKTLITGDIEWDIESFDLSPDGRTLAITVNQDGMSRLIFRRTSGGRDLEAPELPTGVLAGGAFSPDSERFAFTLTRATSPADVYVWDLDSEGLTQWTDSEIGGLDKSKLTDATLIRYPSFDGRQIAAFMYKPAGPGPHPVVIRHNGGPSAQFRPVFSAENQAWANELGIAVIGPNIRGSTGYGKTFTDLDNGMKREDALKDIGALLDWIATQPDLDAKRVAVYGASYGGYIAYGSLIEYGDRIAGAISNVGISDFNTFLLNTAEYRRDLRRVEYGDERVPEMRAFMERISSVRNASRITKPMFVIQGANDPRVPASQAEEMLAAVEKNGAEPWYMLGKDEGHGFAKKVNRDAAIEASALFLERILGRRAN
jgi:dipeptidyl aminopeptidase/acylaminoacyl peptidase